MISKTLWKREFKANIKVILLFLLVLSLYSSLIVAMYDPKLGQSLEMFKESMPGVFEAFGMSNPGSTLIEFIANYLYGFILIVFPMIFVILMCHRLIVRYVDRGSMAYLLSTPHKRTTIILTQLSMLAIGILILVAYVTLLVIVCGNLMFDEGIDFSAFLTLNVGLYGIMLFFAGVCFLFACTFNETRFATGIGAALCIVSVLIQMLSQVGDKLENLKYATPLTLFRPEEIIAMDQGALWSVGVLYIGAIVLFTLGVMIFKRKDLSI